MKQPNVVVIDYGVGNLLSVQRGFEHHNIPVIVSSIQQDILDASHVVLPGVGAFGKAMAALRERGLVDVIKEINQRRKPLLGICLGMQLLFEESHEFGYHEGLGLIPGVVTPLPVQSKDGSVLKSPHIGWGELKPIAPKKDWSGTLLDTINVNDAAYFVHSYMAVPTDGNHVIAQTDFGGNDVTAVVSRENIFACQFHPEKSGNVGLNILKRFCEH